MQIKKNYKNLNFGEFPQKILFSNLSEKVLETRKRKLESIFLAHIKQYLCLVFLNTLYQICDYLLINDFLDFLRLKCLDNFHKNFELKKYLSCLR